MGLTPWQNLVIAEKSELDERLKKLVAFLDSESYADLSSAEQSQLRDQAYAMERYSEVLRERIEAFQKSPV